MKGLDGEASLFELANQTNPRKQYRQTNEKEYEICKRPCKHAVRYGVGEWVFDYGLLKAARRRL
eukprot:8602708-Karenia_brevis.AAC.1